MACFVKASGELERGAGLWTFGAGAIAFVFASRSGRRSLPCKRAFTKLRKLDFLSTSQLCCANLLMSWRRPKDGDKRIGVVYKPLNTSGGKDDMAEFRSW